MKRSSRFTVAIAGATPAQLPSGGPGPGDVPVWTGIEVHALVSRLAERILDRGWRLAYPLRSPFATVMEPLCRRRQPFRPPDDPAALVWFRPSELQLFDASDRNPQKEGEIEEEAKQNAEYQASFYGRLEGHSLLVEIEGEDSARDSLFGLADLSGAAPRPDAFVYIGGRPDEIPAWDDISGDAWGHDYEQFVEEFRQAIREGPVFLVGACGGFARVFHGEMPHIDETLSERNRLDPVDNRCLGEGLVKRRRADGPQVVAAGIWDISRCLFRGLLDLAGDRDRRG
jgi:hypothetical protein